MRVEYTFSPDREQEPSLLWRHQPSCQARIQERIYQLQKLNLHARLSQILDEATHTTVETSLLEENFAVADEDRLDRLLEHKADLYVWLKQKWSELFQADVEVLLYDLTGTYFEGETEENPSTRTF